jgi:hypothetical protein
MRNWRWDNVDLASAWNGNFLGSRTAVCDTGVKNLYDDTRWKRAKKEIDIE